MVKKPRSRKQNEQLTGRRVGGAILIVLITGLVWYTYSAYIVKPAPVYARIDTTFGPIEVELFPASAPRTVSNFVGLATSGFYNNLVWHRIVPGFVIQTGDPNTRNGGGNRSTWGLGGSNQTVPLEIDPSIHNYAMYIGMASSSARDSGTSQFYINLSNSTSNLSLDGNYTVFGKVISGWDVVKQIAAVQTYATAKDFAQPITPVFMIDVIVLSRP